MTGIKSNLQNVISQIQHSAQACGREAKDITLISVSKRKSITAIQEAITSGAADFGENYIQEAIEKIDHIGVNTARWHFIGHLQSNKARFAVKYFDYIHTVGSLKLANEINKQAKKINKIQKILLQINIGLEESKSGALPEQAIDLAGRICELENLSLEGLMGMPPYFPDPEQVREYFKQMVLIKKKIQAKQFKRGSMTHLSMGMSNDFKVAIQEGSTMVRVGTSIFGRRD